MKKQYKCRDCKRLSSILTLGDMYQGCAECGGLSGFDEIIGKKTKPVVKTEKSDAISKFMDDM